MSVFERQLSGTLALPGSAIALAEAVIEDAEGSISARIRIVERADDGRSGEAGELKVDPASFQVDLLDVLAYLSVHLGQE